MVLQGIPGGMELSIILLMLAIYVPVIVGVVGGIGYYLLRYRSGGSVGERLDRIERKVGRLEAQVEALQDSEYGADGE